MGVLARLAGGSTLPILSVVAVIIVVWYAAAIPLNGPRAIEQFEREERDWTTTDLIAAVWSQQRPQIPTPGQVFGTMWEDTWGVATTRYQDLGTALDRLWSHRNSLIYHSRVTMTTTLLGFLLGTGFGIGLAIAIVHVRALDKSMMPWIVASQTIPILAIAPMIVVVLGNIGFTGLMPKAIVSMYLSFFPVTIGMVKGLRAPDPLQRDLMRTYSATQGQVLSKLRWPASMTFLFPSLKVAIALALVGAIVGELPTGARAGIGARLLAGSQFGNVFAMWGAIVASGMLAMLAIGLVSLAERVVAATRGGRM